MPQTETQVIVIGWKLALAIVGGSSALTTLAVFLLARFSHVLRQTASFPAESVLDSQTSAPDAGDQQSMSRQFTEVQMTCDFNFATVRTFRKAVAAGLPAAKDVLLRDITAFYESVFTREQLDARGPHDTVPIRALVTEITTETMANEAQMATDSAALVFAHSILDDAVTQYIRIAATLSPHDWESAPAEKRLSLSDYKRFGSYELALRSMLEKYLAELNGKALITRIKLLNQKCQPMPAEASALTGYKLDLERLAAVDKRRQDIIHRLNLRSSFRDIDADIVYLHNTCHYLGALVSYKYGVTMDEGSMDAVVAKFRAPQGSKLDLAIAEIVRKARE